MAGGPLRASPALTLEVSDILMGLVVSEFEVWHILSQDAKNLSLRAPFVSYHNVNRTS